MPENFWTTRAQPSIFLLMCLQNLTVVVETNMHFFVQCADKSLARPGRKQANVSVRMAWISFGALPCKKKKTLWKFASRCCWNRARPWHASELVSFLVGLGTYQHPGMSQGIITAKEWSKKYQCLCTVKIKIFSLLYCTTCHTDMWEAMWSSTHSSFHDHKCLVSFIPMYLIYNW